MLRRSSIGILTVMLTALVWTASVTAQTKTTTKKATTTKNVGLAATDINSATEDSIVTTLGVDKTIAKKIVDGRPWRSKRMLVSKNVLTADQYSKLKDRIVAKQPLNAKKSPQR